MERKIYEAQIKQFTGEGRGAAVLARLGVRDKDGDVLVRGLLGGEQQAPLIQGHDWQVPSFGRAVVRERGDELVADFVLNLETARGREWASVLKFDLAQAQGPLQQWSWGFSIPPDGAEMGMHEGQRVRLLKRIQLHEVSPVVVGASIGSRTLALKAAEDQEALAAQTARVVAEYERLRARQLPEPGRFGYKFKELWTGGAYYQTAWSAAKHAARECGVPMPTLKFFLPAAPGDRADFTKEFEVGGFADIPGGVIALAADLDEDQITEVAAHEVGHLRGYTEEGCKDFGRRFREKYAAVPSRPLRSGLAPAAVAALAQAWVQRGYNSREISRIFS